MTLEGPVLIVAFTAIVSLVGQAFSYGKIVQRLNHHDEKISEIIDFLKNKFGGI